MHMRLQIVFILMLFLQAWKPAVSQAATPELPDSRGVLQRLAHRAGEAKAKIKSFGETVFGYAGAYYEDHIQPVAGSYVEWASNLRSSLWEKVQTAIDNYMPPTE